MKTLTAVLAALTLVISTPAFGTIASCTRAEIHSITDEHTIVHLDLKGDWTPVIFAINVSGLAQWKAGDKVLFCRDMAHTARIKNLTRKDEIMFEKVE